MDINLLPWRNEIERKRIKIFLYQLLASCCIALIVCAVLYIKGLLEVSIKNERIRVLEAEVLQGSEGARKDSINLETGKVGFLEEKISQNKFLLSLLSFLGKKIPDAVYLNKVEKKESTIYIYGRSLSQENVVTLVNEIGAHLQNKEIEIDEISWVEDGPYHISFVVSLAENNNE